MSWNTRTILRETKGEHHRVTFAELFFDLVFVFAVTQLSHTLLHHLDPMGALQVVFLFLAVWWAWIDTAWVTNWIDPDKAPVRLLLLLLMLAGLVMSMSLPAAFGDLGLAFACAYAVFQCGRSAYMFHALRHEDPALRRNFQRILAWHLVIGAFWIAGGLADGNGRLALWALALVLENAAPILGFFVPGLGKSQTTEWTVEGGHMAERCALFVIIALGESILVTGATFAELPWSAINMGAFLVAFLGTVAMWWIYFDTGAERSTARITSSDDPGRQARLAYTYLHMLIVLGIILCAVSDEVLLAHPADVPGGAAAAVILGGPALYLLGVGLFKWPLLRRFPLSHLVGLGVILLSCLLAPFASALVLAGCATLGLLATAAWETFALRKIGVVGAD
ncbi:low temperature requirement protein A [Xanthobacter sp. DSM 24535]|uniref:low temperature requirement protein A n=1 Tax=Roseixanthobacter psychrophilus TaxID=3119917 RepID=UPI0037298145